MRLKAKIMGTFTTTDKKVELCTVRERDLIFVGVVQRRNLCSLRKLKVRRRSENENIQQTRNSATILLNSG